MFFRWPTDWIWIKEKNVTRCRDSAIWIVSPVLINIYIQIGVRATNDVKSWTCSFFETLYHSFNLFPMLISWDMNKLRQFIDYIKDVRLCDGQILQFSKDLQVANGITMWRSVSHSKRYSGTHGSRNTFSIFHIQFGENIKNIFLLRKNGTI